MTDREKFEAWLTSLPGFEAADVAKGEEGKYNYRETEWCWKSWKAALASQQPADDGWLHWNGERALPPVESMQRVQVKLRNGDVREHYAQNFAWRNAPTKRGVDIIAYRVVKP